MPLSLALAVRESVARHRLGALEGVPPPLPMHSCPVANFLVIPFYRGRHPYASAVFYCSAESSHTMMCSSCPSRLHVFFSGGGLFVTSSRIDRFQMAVIAGLSKCLPLFP